jgi:hypothetical protein
MFLLYSIFSVSVLASLFMIFFRLRELENGKIPFPDRKELSKQFQVFAVWEKKMWEGGKRLALRSLASSLKFMVSWTDRARKFMRKQIIRMEEALVKKRVSGEASQGASSFFLKDIAEHKKRMKLKK